MKRMPPTPKRISTQGEAPPKPTVPRVSGSWRIAAEAVSGGGRANVDGGGGDGSGGAGEGGGGGGGDGSGGSDGGGGGWGGKDGGGGAVGGGGDGGGGDGAATASKLTVGGVTLITETPSAAVSAAVVVLASVAEAAEAALAVGRMTRASTVTLAGATVRATSVASGKRASRLDLKPCLSKEEMSPATVKLVRMTC